MPIPSVFSVVGSSGTGKTTLLEKLLPALKERGIRIGTIKHDVHGFEMDKPGKDSWRHKRAGASISVISSSNKIGMVRDTDHDWKINELMTFFPDVHLILTEGYKSEGIPKIEVFRPEVHKNPVCKGDKNLIAVISDSPVDLGVPVFGTEEVNALADFLTARLEL